MKGLIKATAITFVALSLSGCAATVFAQGSASTSARTELKETAQQTRVTTAKARADKEIDNRINSLNGLITRINNIKKLSSTNKTALTQQVNDQISSLTTLKAKIDADTDITTLKTDVKSIVDSYRIYALFIPRTHLLVGADDLLQVADTLTAVQTKLQARVDAAKTSGKDVTALQASLTDMTSKIADAKTQVNNAINTVLPLQPSPDPSTYKPTLQSAKKMLQAAHQDLVAARKDAQDTVQGLKAMGANTATSSALQKQ